MQSAASMCSAEYNRIFMNVLQDKGVDVLAWLQSASMDFEITKKFGGFMLYKDIEGFFNRHVEPLQISGLGLAVGQRTDMTSHGSISHAILSSPNIEEGLKTFERFMKLRVNFIKMNIIVDNRHVTFEFAVTENMQPYVKRFYLECAISGTNTFLKQLLKTNLYESTCSFDYPEPCYLEQYEELLGNNLSFDQETTSIQVAKEYFDALTSSGNSSIFKLATQQCENELEQLEQAEDIVSKIRSLLIESPWIFPTQEQVASQCAMSIRTLRRKLTDAGTTYQVIMDSVRESLAKEYLQNTQWSVQEIADMLGYSEPNNFNRAFKRWSGFTPSEYRQQYRIQNSPMSIAV